MKKFVTSTIIALLLTQSIIPATYASTDTSSTTSKLSTGKRVNSSQDDAAGISKDATTNTSSDYGYGATTTQTPSATTTATSFVDRYKTSDLGTLKPLDVVQVAIVGYAYQIGGTEIFSDQATYYNVINQFLDKYAPNFGFRMGNKLPDGVTSETDYYYQLAQTWSKNFSKEYDAVYAYAKAWQTGTSSTTTNSVQETKTTTPVAAKASTACVLSKEDENEIFQYKISYEKLIQENKLTEASEVFKKIEATAAKCSGGSSNSVVEFKQDCSIAYTRYMAEYDNLIAKNAPMAEITSIKAKISDAENGKNCTIQTKVEQTEEKHRSLVAQVKEALNFGKNTESVIPVNVIPNYCAADVVNGLQEQLAANDVEKLNDIKGRISNILEDGLVRENQNKKSILQFALNTAATVETDKILKSNVQKKEQLAMDNLSRNLAVMADALITSRGVKTILNFFDNNMDNVEAMAEALNNVGEFKSFEYVVQNGGSAYEWDGTKFVQKKDTTDQDDIIFGFPSNKDSLSNDARITLRSLKTHTYEQISSRGATDIKISLDKYNTATPTGFGQAAKDNGTRWTMGIPVVAMSNSLYNTLKPNGTWYGDINGEQVLYVNFYIAQLGNEVRAYTNYDLNTYLPVGSYEAYWSRYDVSTNGVLSEVYINEIPLELAAKAEVNGRTIAAIEGKLTWADDAALKQSDSIFPMSIEGKIYLANFLLDVNIKRQKVSGSNWKLSLDASLQGPSICTLKIQGELNYKNGNEANIELTENDLLDANFSLTFNNDTLTFVVEELDELVSTIKGFDNNVNEKGENTTSPEQYVDAINDYVQASYSFDGDELAQIVADAEQYVVVQYPDESTEAVIDLAMRYASLVNVDYLMQVIEQFMGDGGGKEPAPEPVYDYSKFYSNVWNDGSYVYANYNYTYADGKTTSVVYPDKVDMVVYIKGEGCTSAYCNTTQYSANYDGSQYVFDYSSIANDPTVVAAYVYATYTSQENGKYWDDTYYVLGSAESIKDHSSAPTDVFGCTDATANNYDTKATKDDGTCKYDPSISMDIAGYSLISAQDPSQFMIGFKLSSDTESLIAPDSVGLTLYYTDGTKSTTSLSQGADGYYVGPNYFIDDDNITEVLVSASTMVDGKYVSTSYTLKSPSPQSKLDLLR